MADPKDIFGSYGSVPDLTEGGATIGQRFGVRASPDDFGAQIGQATQYAGQVKRHLGDLATDWVAKEQGKINETLATNALAEYQIEAAKLKGQYDSLDGLAAVGARDKYIQDLQKLRTNIGSRLGGDAGRAFQSSAVSHEASYIGDAYTYSIQQADKAHKDSMLLSANIAQGSMLDPSKASDPALIGEALGNVTYAHQAMLDSNSPGVVFDPETETHKFADTPEGQAAKSNFKTGLDYSKGIVWENAITTTADHDPLKASKLYSENRDVIPADARVRIEAMLAPKVIDAYAQNATNDAMNEIARGHQEAVLRPSSVGSNAYNLGNVKTPEAAAAGTAGFEAPQTPVDGALLAANTLRRGYQGLTLTQIGNKWAPSSENVTSDWVRNVSVASGISPDTVPNLNDPATLSAMLKGILVAEKSPKDRAHFTDDVIQQGVQASLAGAKPELKAKTQLPGVPDQEYARNSAGGPMSRADYAAIHRMEILSNWEQWAMDKSGGDATFASKVVTRIDGQITDMIQQQTATYSQDKTIIQQAINGMYSDGTPPATYEALRAIPEVKEALDRAEVHSPDFTRDIDAKIARVAGSAGKETKEYGPAFFTLMRKIHSGDIKSSDDLIAHLPEGDKPGDITYSGYEKLVKEFTHDAETQSDAEMKTQAFKVIKRQLSAEDETFGIKDPKGEALFSQAMPILFKAIDEGKSKGLTMGELTDPSNPAWIGNKVKSLERTQEQIMVDTFGDGASVTGTEDKATPSTKHWWEFWGDSEPKPRTPASIYLEYKTETDPVKKEALKKEALIMLRSEQPAPSAPTGD